MATQTMLLVSLWELKSAPMWEASIAVSTDLRPADPLTLDTVFVVFRIDSPDNKLMNTWTAFQSEDKQL